MNRRLILCALAAVLALPGAAAQDFGLILSGKGALTDGDRTYGHAGGQGTAIPWFAAPLGEEAGLYVSGGLTLSAAGAEGGGPEFIPEVYRTEITYNPFPGLRLELGRLPFKDRLSCLMEGLFDGAALHLNLGGGRLEAGMFYTGLLYKKAAYIVMSPEDRANYDDRDHYFASPRLAAALNWEYADILGSRNSLYLSGLCQFDLNRENRFDSQYLGAKLGLPLHSSILVELGGAVELAEKTDADPAAAFILLAELQWLPPASLPGRLTLNGLFASGNWNQTIRAFSPLTSRARGQVLRPVLSGIALAGAGYTLRFHPKISGELSGTYYFRTDTETYTDTHINPESNSPLAGGELYGGLVWAPFSDLLFSAGGGVFLPGTGRAFNSDAPVKYRLELTASMVF